jgi:GxxExxY protein
MTENEISKVIVSSALEVHRTLGPGLLESAYQQCLKYELINSGLNVISEKPISLNYKGVKLDQGYRIDLLVENKVVIELKSVERFHGIHLAQMLTYLKLGEYKLGLLINFNSTLIKYGIKRVIR